MAKIEKSGSLFVKENSPYIYFIRRGGILYIGETQRIPLSRWGEHFSSEGSFRKALQKVERELYSDEVFTELYVYRCITVETDVSEIDRKRATQYIENQVHLKFYSSGTNFRLISDTVRTTPIYNKFNWLKPDAEQLYSSFITDLHNQKV